MDDAVECVANLVCLTATVISQVTFLGERRNLIFLAVTAISHTNTQTDDHATAHVGWALCLVGAPCEQSLRL